MSLDALGKYIGLFGNLHRNHNPRLGAAPHKPILLLAVLDEIERGHIQDNFIPLTPELVAAFRDNWRVLVPEATWMERIANPFRFLVQDGFWTLVKNENPVSTQSLGYNPTLTQLTTAVDGATLEPDLWQLLQDRSALQSLRTHVLQTYFGRKYTDVQPALHSNPIDYEAEKLKAEAQSQFRVRQVREGKEETGYYVRHALFPRVVKDLYRNACAVCALSAHTEEGSGVIDAAHILPFVEFHNDDPRNGIALCKNHHWGFDAGWYAISDEYRILVSPQLRDSLPYITAAAPLHLPDNLLYAPDLSALRWHRNTRYQK
jgi:putative restriction endonuclease